MTRLEIELRHESEAQPVPIVSDAAMASVGIADGKLIPLAILDTSTRPDIEEVAQAHRHLGTSGDVRTAWLRQSWRDRRHLRLVLQFIQPISCVVLIEFDLHRYAGFVDQIVLNEALYVQPGRAGDRLKTNVDAARIMAEVDCEDFRPIWNRIFEREAAEYLRRGGMRRRDAKRAARDFIGEWRELTLLRMGDPSRSESE